MLRVVCVSSDIDKSISPGRTLGGANCRQPTAGVVGQGVERLIGRRRSPPYPINTQHSHGQDLDAMRGQISGVFKLEYNCAVHGFTESHDRSEEHTSELQSL